MIKRTECVICTKPDLQHLHTFPKFPIFMGAKEDAGKDQFEDQRWGICEGCGCIQLLELIPLDTLYKHSHNSGVGPTWKDHNIAFAELAVQYCSERVLEIGGGNQRIADDILARENYIAEYKIYDKHSYKLHSNPKIKYQDQFFDPYKKTDEFTDTIILSHVFEHLYEPLDYVGRFFEILRDDGHIVLSIPHISNGLRNKFANALCFEHTYQLDFTYLDILMNAQGFECVHYSEYNEFNIFAVYQKTGRVSFEGFRGFYPNNKRIFQDFLSYHKKNVQTIIPKLYDFDEVYIFGCHVFSQLLLNMGLPEELLDGVLDNDPLKQGKLLYGSHLKTFSPEVIKDKERVSIIVQAGVYTPEITQQLLKINPRCQILS